LGELHL